MGLGPRTWWDLVGSARTPSQHLLDPSAGIPYNINYEDGYLRYCMRVGYNTRHFPAGQEARSVTTFIVLRSRSSSPSEVTTWTWRHSLTHSFYGHPQAADTTIGIGHVFVNLTQKVRQNLVPKLVPNMPVLKLNLTFWSFYKELNNRSILRLLFISPL